MKNENSIERLSPKSTSKIPEGRLAWIEECHLDGAETAEQGATIAYGTGVSSDGALGLMLAVRGADDKLSAGALLDPAEGMRVGHWLMRSAIDGLERYCSYAEDREELVEAVGKGLRSAFLESFPEMADKYKEEQYKLARQTTDLENRAFMGAMREKIQADVERKFRTKVLRLARAAAELDDTKQTELIADLMPWIAEIHGELLNED